MLFQISRATLEEYDYLIFLKNETCTLENHNHRELFCNRYSLKYYYSQLPPMTVQGSPNTSLWN